MAKMGLNSAWPKSCKCCNIRFYHPKNDICGWCYDKKERKNNRNHSLGTENARLVAWGLVVFMLVVLLMSDATLKGAETKYRLVIIGNGSEQPIKTN